MCVVVVCVHIPHSGQNLSEKVVQSAFQNSVFQQIECINPVTKAHPAASINR